MSRRQGALLGVVTLALSATALAADWVGADSCKACHSKAFEAWAADPHAHAADSLTEAQRRQPSCTHCHAPELAARAAAEASGRAATTRAPSAEQLHGIGCESCHGAGQYYSPIYVMKDSELARAVGLLDPGEHSCKGCHLAGSPSLEPFDFKAKIKLIDHWSAERAALKATSQAETPAPTGTDPGSTP